MEANQYSWSGLIWKKMPVRGVPPCPRSYGGMVVHGECLIVFGGIGKPLKASGLPASDLGGVVIKDTRFGGEFESEWNNYIHEYSIISGMYTNEIEKGSFLFWFEIVEKWRELSCTGVRPPPLERFSFDKIDSHRALLFGGKRGLFTAGYQDIYILDLNTMVRLSHRQSLGMGDYVSVMVCILVSLVITALDWTHWAF